MSLSLNTNGIVMDNWSNSSVSLTPMTRQSSELSLYIQDDSSPLLNNAIQNIDLILSNQTKALSFLTSQYRNSQFSIDQMKMSLRILNNSLNVGGKIIISGMGKSFKIASKTVATMNSLRMHSALLHPSEALHGDLGIIREDHNDSLIIISASGNSPELLQMLEHIPTKVPIILMTCNKNSILARHSKVVSLLLAEIPSNLSENNLYGLSAPTISTTLCLTMLDAVSIALSELHINDYNIRKSVFGIHHPGGAIGINYKKELEINDEIDNGIKKEIMNNNNDNNDSNDNNDNNNILNETEADYLNINDLALLKRLQDSKYKQEVDELPTDENKFLKVITINDYLIIKDINLNNQRILDCETARSIYRECTLNQETWPETIWRLAESCTVLATL